LEWLAGRVRGVPGKVGPPQRDADAPSARHCGAKAVLEDLRAGQFYLKHGKPPPRGELDVDLVAGPLRRERPSLAPGAAPLDATARAMRRVAARPKTTAVKQTKRQIRET